MKLRLYRPRVTWLLNFLPLLLLLVQIPSISKADGTIPGIQVQLPPSHTALSGDLHIEIISSSFPPLLLQLSRLEGDNVETLTTLQVLPEARSLTLNKTLVRVPCGYFSHGGQYYVLIKKQPFKFLNSSKIDEDVITRGLDVRWPMPQLSLTPEHVQTYPEVPVSAILEFPEVVCPPAADSPASAIPEFWLELHYCGHSLLSCDTFVPYTINSTKAQVLYSEQVRGFPGRRMITLACKLFGLAGHYALFLRPTTSSPTLPHTAAYVKADWSEQFVFNVHARSIFPCESHGGGIPVLFEYPSCILSSGDKVRLFARLRASVASLAPPTSLEYVTEQRIVKGQHALYFDCDLFVERYVEYCFVYVSQAITGAVADVRMDCVPTLPVAESESGGWGPWSSWTPCSTTCTGGTRNRYRLCDSPPPRYGAKFCEGPSVQTENCGQEFGSSWECIYGGSASASEIALDFPDMKAEMSPQCRCGCVVHLSHAKFKRLIATSSQSCPGRTFWLIQAENDHIIQFQVDQLRFPCGSQWLKIRDGSSLSANLLADLSDTLDSTPFIVNASNSKILLEFYSDEDPTISQTCNGGFVAQAFQMKHTTLNVTMIPVAQGIGVIPSVMLKLTAVHIAAIFFLSGLLVATTLLAGQYACRYRKYHIAQAEDCDSLTENSASLPVRTRASSNATLLSEVISLRKFRPVHSRPKHSRLRESVDCESFQEATLAKEEDSLSGSSTITLTQPGDTTQTTQITTQADITSCSLPTSPNLDNSARRSSTSTSQSDKDNFTEKALQNTKRVTLSNITLTNVSNLLLQDSSKSDPGCYSPAMGHVNTAKIRATNEKESKEKKNREKLLAGPVGSEFSIAGNDTELEMDYYDYNVVNAGAAPGSYLGMDPAFLVWIPPLDETGEILDGLEQANQQYMEITSALNVDPGSNKESPNEDDVVVKDRMISGPIVTISNPRCEEAKREQFIIKVQDNSVHSDDANTIALRDFTAKLSRDSMEEKDIEVTKLSVDSNILNEIKFVDDDEDDDEDCNLQCNNEQSYQDSNNIQLTSS